MLRKETFSSAYHPQTLPLVNSPNHKGQATTLSRTYYPNIAHHRPHNIIAPAVEPYRHKDFPIPRSEMTYSYEQYQNHMRSAYEPYAYYHHSTANLSGVDVKEQKLDKPAKPRAARSVEDEDMAERKKKFLERNRIAASKCRQKRKLLTQELETRSSELFQQNRELKLEINILQGENQMLKERLLKYEGANCNNN